MDIKNKVIIVTGASEGIGLETVKLLAKEGANVVLAARNEGKLKEISKSLPNSLAIPTDMRNAKAIGKLIETTKKKFGRIDVLVNNAGQGMYNDIEHVNVDDYRQIVELNVIGPLIAMQKVIPIMREQGGGTIINISSMVSKSYFPYLGAYASTKYALNALTLTARAELEKENIIVALVHPGLTATEFGKNAVKTDLRDRMAPRARTNMPEPDSAQFVATRILDAIHSSRSETYMHE